VTRARRRAGASSGERIVFRGPPDRLASLVASPVGDAEAAAEQEPEATLRGAEVRGLSVRTLARAGDARRATLRLAKSTPPGTYRGSAEIEGQKVPIVVEVEGRPCLEADPRRIIVEAAPGGKATVGVTLLNTGNVPCDVSETTRFCLFDGGGVEHAFWAALASDLPKGKQRVDVLLDDLADSHGGLVTLAVEDGAAIAPGESRDVRLTLRFPDRLRPGKRYAGAWRAEGLRVPIRVTTPAAKAKRTRAPK
jgi:hypothetical protein